MLTGWESVPAAFVATAWQHGDAWGSVLAAVRTRTEALLGAGVGAGDRIAVTDDLVLQLAVLTTGAVAVLDGSGGDPAPGGAVGDATPDAFEQAWLAVDPTADAVVAGATFTHENLVAAVRSLALATGAGPGRTLRVELPVTVPGAHLLAPLTGARLVPAGAADIVLAEPAARTAPGFAGVLSLDGKLLPGVALEEVDGRVRVRSDAVAPSRRTAGWLEVA